MVMLVVDCDKIKTEVAIELFNEIVKLIKTQKLDTYVSCSIHK
jgi:hypothetical protein